MSYYCIYHLLVQIANGSQQHTGNAVTAVTTPRRDPQLEQNCWKGPAVAGKHFKQVTTAKLHSLSWCIQRSTKFWWATVISQHDIIYHSHHPPKTKGADRHYLPSKGNFLQTHQRSMSPEFVFLKALQGKHSENMHASLKVPLHAWILPNNQWNPNQLMSNQHQDLGQIYEILQEAVFTAVCLMK